MKHPGMTEIVRNTARLIAGFIALFGIYIAATGHISPGGGFAGGVILAASGALVVLAFGRTVVTGALTEENCHVWDAAGALGFLAIALLGFLAGGFFVNFINVQAGEEKVAANVHKLMSGGMVPLANLAILVKVGAALLGAFLALSAFRSASARPEKRP